MKSLDELKKIRYEAKEKMAMRGSGDQDYRVVVGMATCGIAAGARPVLNTLVEEVAKAHLPVTVMHTAPPPEVALYSFSSSCAVALSICSCIFCACFASCCRLEAPPPP